MIVEESFILYEVPVMEHNRYSKGIKHLIVNSSFSFFFFFLLGIGKTSLFQISFENVKL